MYSCIYTLELILYVKLLVMVPEKFLNRQQGIFPAVCRYGGTALAAAMPIFIGDPVNILGVLPFFCLGFYYGFKGSPLSRISLALIVFSILISINILADFLGFDFFYFYEVFGIDAMTKEQFQVLRGTAKVVLMLILYRIVRRMAISEGEKEKRELSGKMWYLIDVLAMMPFASVLIWVTLTNRGMGEAQNRTGMIAVFLILPVVILSSMGLLALIHLLYRQQELEERENMWKMQKIYYDHVEEEQKRIRRLRHDMANHLQMLIMMDKGEQMEYINSIMATPAMKSQKRFCENAVINTVVGCKAYRMEEKGIPFEAQLSYPEPLPMESVELCSLFGNALDNALEACEKVEKKENRFISMKGRAEKNLLMLQVVNSYRDIPDLKKGTMKTTKKDKGNHGFGLVNMQQIVDNHKGTMDVRWDENEFVLSVTLVIT